MPDHRGHVTRRRWAAVYRRGLLLDGHRQSVEPMAQRLRATDGCAGDYQQALPQVLNPSPGDDPSVRDRLTRRVVATGGTGGCVLVADTGFPKQGTHAVGVARPYAGTRGKVGNGQLAVPLPYATAPEVFALDAHLYRPEEGGCARDRLQAAGGPRDLGYRPKWHSAWALRGQAKANGLNGVVVTDSAYGDATECRQTLDEGRWP